MQKLSSVVANESVGKLMNGAQIAKQQLIHSYAIAPGDKLSILAQEDTIKTVHWGFSRNDETSILQAIYITVHSKPTFRMCFRNNRCIVLLDSFYVWSQEKPSPYRLANQNGKPLWIPGLWREDSGRKEAILITRPARKSIKEMSSQEPIIMNEEHVNVWLKKESAVSDLINMLHSIRPYELRCKATNVKVLIPGYNHRDLHKDYEVQPSLF